ncbi:MAG TPA: hypothetical protein VD886_26740 [Herpetosiphonaceae bacterium]|nr:hypothetical protein [Herpetosiphonaceae bacterium]
MMNPDQQHYTVNTEYDVVVLRHALRQLGRTLGLSLVQQARITAAISDIARDVLQRQWSIVFTLIAGQIGLRRALDVVCQKPAHYSRPSDHEFETQLGLVSARQLLDDASFSTATGHAVLTLRMWI